MRITCVKKAMVIAALLGASLCAGVANAGAETNKTIASLILNDCCTPLVTVNGAEESSVCSFGLIAIPEGPLKSTRLAMIIAAKISQSPVSILFNASCVMTDIRFTP
jgi:hypothetical protein